MKIRKQFGQDWRNWNQRALLMGMEGRAVAMEDRTVLLKKIKWSGHMLQQLLLSGLLLMNGE